MIFDPNMSVYNICDRSYRPFADNIHLYRSVLASSSAWLPLLYDTVVIVLIAHRTLPVLRLKNRYSIMKRLLEDGLIYYTYATSIVDSNIRIHMSGLRAIFTVNAVLTIMIIAAPPGLKNITAQ